GGTAEREGPVGRSQNVHAPVADQAGPEIVEAAPIERQIEAKLLLAAAAATTTCISRGDEILIFLIARGERPLSSAAEPEIPIERIRDGRGCSDLRHLLRPRSAAGPGMHFTDLADLARPNDLAGHARRVVRITLIAHLCGDFVLGGRLCQ